MKAKAPLLISFAAGVAFAAVVGFFAVVRWNGQQSEMLWSSFLHNYALDAQRLSRGEQELVLQGMERRLPSMVLSVHSFGDNETTRGALQKAKEFYQTSGTPMPPEIASILASR